MAIHMRERVYKGKKDKTVDKSIGECQWEEGETKGRKVDLGRDNGEERLGDKGTQTRA